MRHDEPAEATVFPFPDRRLRHRKASDPDDGMVARAIAAAQQGDREAVAFLYARYADRVHRYVNRLVRDEHLAEDVTQQVFAKLMSVIVRYEQRAMPFHAWLFRVARNVALDEMRARRCIPTPDVDLPEPSTTQHDPAGSVLHQALSTLPVDQRSVMFLRHVVGLSPREIGRRLGKSESSVHGLQHRGRAALKRELERAHAAPATAARRCRPALA